MRKARRKLPQACRGLLVQHRGLLPEIWAENENLRLFADAAADAGLVQQANS
jgi:hypothetical protein